MADFLKLDDSWQKRGAMGYNNNNNKDKNGLLSADITNGAYLVRKGVSANAHTAHEKAENIPLPPPLRYNYRY